MSLIEKGKDLFVAVYNLYIDKAESHLAELHTFQSAQSLISQNSPSPLFKK